MATFLLPKKIKSDFEGYAYLAYLCNELSSLRKEQIVLDFKYVTWFEANLCSILGAILADAEEGMNKVVFANMNRPVQDILERNDFLSYYGGWERMDGRSTVIAFKKFKVTDESGFRHYLDADLLSLPDLPKMSELARRKILESIFEIFNNAGNHAGCRYVFTCGQYFPNLKELKFTIVDLGTTIRTNVSKFQRKSVSGKEAIQWAVMEGNTTRTGSIPGGLGISTIRTFLHMNGGDVQIVSADGYWKEKAGRTFGDTMASEFQGTIVNLEFNMNDMNSYVLKSELDDTSLF